MEVDRMSARDLDLVYREFQDHASFCRTSLIVETESKELVPMELGAGQQRLRDAIAKQRAKGVPVRIIYLKSRRIQATTGTAAQYFHSTAFRPGVHSAVIAHDDTSTQNIFKIYKRFHDRYRPFAGVIRLPRSKVLADKVCYEYGGDPESSFIQVKTAGTFTFGRSFRLTNVHFSEFPYYAKPAEILSAVMSAVPKLPDTCAVIEGTAKTIGDPFNAMWQAATDPSVESEWIGLFMGWWEHPTNRMPLPAAADRFQDSLSRDERDIMARYRLDLEQLAWRRWTVQNDFLGDLLRFKREHPAAPEEAFSANARNRFSVPHIMRAPLVRNPMVGEVAMEEVGQEKRPAFFPSDRGPVRIFRLPERGRKYACGADPSGGRDVSTGSGEADPDYAAAQIVDRETREQVAVFRARVMPGEFGRLLYRLLRFYNNGQVALEITGVGIATLESLLNEGYPAALIYHRPAARDQDPIVRSDKIGWETGDVSRQQLLSALDEALRQDALYIRDPITQQELLTFVINSRGKAEAQAGTHDDTVLALALAVIVMTRMPIPVTPDVALRPEVRRYGQPARDMDRRGERVSLRSR